MLCHQLGMDTDDERLFVIATIENADPPAFWQTLARARTIDKSIAALNEFSALLCTPSDAETLGLIGSALCEFGKDFS